MWTNARWCLQGEVRDVKMLVGKGFDGVKGGSSGIVSLLEIKFIQNNFLLVRANSLSLSGK